MAKMRPSSSSGEIAANDDDQNRIGNESTLYIVAGTGIRSRISVKTSESWRLGIQSSA